MDFPTPEIAAQENAYRRGLWLEEQRVIQFLATSSSKAAKDFISANDAEIRESLYEEIHDEVYADYESDLDDRIRDEVEQIQDDMETEMFRLRREVAGLRKQLEKKAVEVDKSGSGQV
jgi:hypothetical protein